MKVTDEVIYVMTDPIHFIGRNENAGQSLRHGLDVSFVGRPRAGTTLQASCSYITARFDAGEYAGNDLTMIPKLKFNFGASHDLTSQLRLSSQIVCTGAQYVISDESNTLLKLPAYWRADLRARYSVRKWAVEGAIRNLTNNKYSTRAITDGFMTYFTPAAGINAEVAVNYQF